MALSTNRAYACLRSVALSTKRWPREAWPCRQNGLACSIDLLEKHGSVDEPAWRGLDAFASSSGARVERDAGGVPGLHVCRDFLNEDEVRWLRRLFSAHQGWAMYNWGSVGKNGGVGKNGDLASMLERIAAG